MAQPCKISSSQRIIIKSITKSINLITEKDCLDYSDIQAIKELIELMKFASTMKTYLEGKQK